MLKVAGNELSTQAMDHHGIVASQCKDLKIAEKINARIDTKDPRQIVSPGIAVEAMILNGLGFTNRRLYLTPQFFANKPVDRLLSNDIEANHLNDYALGKSLDSIAAYGTSKLFGEMAFEIGLENNLLDMAAHLDTTSLSVEGNYDITTAPETINITHGHSKDHRPDLKQVVLSIVANGPAGMPIWMEPLDGNSSDKESFHETIKKVNAFKEQVKGCPDFKWIADSAFYTKEKLAQAKDYLWISRVPETISKAKKLAQLADTKIDWIERKNGYKTATYKSTYGDVEQRWLLVYSQQAYEREKITFKKKLKKQKKTAEKSLWHLSNEVFETEKAAKAAVKKTLKSYAYYQADTTVEPVYKHLKPGRPKKGAQGELVGYKVQGNITRDEKRIEEALNSKGRFILATNDMNKETCSDEDILQTYKEQQKVEGGFRFLKDPWFMVDSVFLKTPKRIEALMMVMTLCLLVYNVSQYHLRKQLQTHNETLPNQLNKPIKNPTMRWIFQLMEGVGIVKFYEDNIKKPAKEVITNLNTLREKIIRLFGKTACGIYGLAYEVGFSP